MRKIIFIVGLICIFSFALFSGLVKVLTPGFNNLQSPSSNLAAGPYGWLQNLAFITGGIGVILIGINIFTSLSNKTKFGPSLIILFGIILVIESYFQSNPYQTDMATRIHIMLFMVGVIGMLFAVFIIATRLLQVSKNIAWYSYITGIVSLIGFAGIFATQGQTGIWQQVAVGPLFLWLIITDIYTFVKYKKLVIL